MCRAVCGARVYVQVTDRCQAGCAHCGFDCLPTGTGSIEPSALTAFLDDFERRHGPPSHLALTGGEPMLEPELVYALARLAADRGIVVRLMTHAGFARSPDEAREAVASLVRAGVAGLWVSAGAFHDRAIGSRCIENLLAEAGRAGLPAFLSFAYLRPLGRGMRGKGLVKVDARIAADRQTAGIHARWARRLPAWSHGWARIWDMGRARALIDGLGPALGATLRRELHRAEVEDGGLKDLTGLGLDGRVLEEERFEYPRLASGRNAG